MSATDELLANNARYARALSGPVPGRPSLQVAVVACMDARMDVYALLGLAPGQAHVLHNAGGQVTEDVLRSLTISQHGGLGALTLRLPGVAHARSLTHGTAPQGRPRHHAGGRR